MHGRVATAPGSLGAALGGLLAALVACPTPANAMPEEPAPPPARCPEPAPDAVSDWAGQARWETLEQAGYRLGEIRIEVQDVYVGGSLPWYQELANTLHTDTEPEVVRDLLTIAPGERVRAERVYEAERVLRRRDFFTDARILPARCTNGHVDTVVRVRDAWTLQLGVGLGRAGGESTQAVGFTDENFLGTGKTLALGWSEGRDRTSVQLGYSDPSLFGSSWTLDLTHRELSDGDSDTLELAYPYRRADQAWAVRTELVDETVELDFEQNSETAFTATIDARQADVEVLRLLQRDGRRGWRAGAGWRHDEVRYGPLETVDESLRPAPSLGDRDLSGPYFALEHFSERYESFRNLQSIGKTEDYDLGFDGRLALGRFTRAPGDDDPWFLDFRLGHGLTIGDRDLLLTQLAVATRYRETTGRQAYYRSLTLDYYHRTSRRNTVVLHGEYDRRDRLDPEDELYLGGFDGLLAYPDRFRAGDRRWLIHLEDRYVSDIVLFDTVQLGYTAYLEAGRIRGLDGRWTRTLSNLGAGLRLGSLRSSFGTVGYLTVAFPLVDAGQREDYSLVVGSTVNF